jgi:hypothetical protein
MAAAEFYVWDRLGRPWTLTTPLVDLKSKMRAAFASVVLGTLGDASHLGAVPPQDHTPYSADGYPRPNPEWVVHAIDVMHHPESGVDCAVLFGYWLSEARAGRMPWLKYLIWQAKIYDVRHGWIAQSSSGHYDHVHLSARTDTESTHLGGWSPVPPAPVAPTPAEDDMPGLFKIQGSDTLYLSDGFRRKTLSYPMWQQYKAAWGDRPVSVVPDEPALSALAGPDWQEVTGPAAAVDLAAIAKAVNDDAAARLVG